MEYYEDKMSMFQIDMFSIINLKFQNVWEIHFLVNKSSGGLIYIIIPSTIKQIIFLCREFLRTELFFGKWLLFHYSLYFHFFFSLLETWAVGYILPRKFWDIYFVYCSISMYMPRNHLCKRTNPQT